MGRDIGDVLVACSMGSEIPAPGLQDEGVQKVAVLFAGDREKLPRLHYLGSTADFRVFRFLTMYAYERPKKAQ